MRARKESIEIVKLKSIDVLILRQVRASYLSKRTSCEKRIAYFVFVDYSIRGPEQLCGTGFVVKLKSIDLFCPIQARIP